MEQPRIKPPTRIPSDDFTVEAGDEVYHPHAGEWVEMSTRTTVKETRALRRFLQFASEMQALEGEPNAGAEFLRVLDEEFDTLTAGLASRVRDWNWTDDHGQELPKPDGTSTPFENLSAEELFYLINLSNRGASGESRKNASGAMPTTGSDSQPTPIPTPFGMAPSPMKAM
jgi:hypothetical protein